MKPVISICIPTFNRAPFLDDCLSKVASFSDSSIPLEILISDNASTDDTLKIVEHYARTNPSIKFFRQPQNQGPFQNQVNAYRMASGKFVTYLADDDSIIFENLLTHVMRLELETDLSAIFTDWIAWDDDQGREIHRYFNISDPISFGPEDPLGLVNFLFQSMLPPEIGIYRRSALLEARSFHSSIVPFHLWAYALSRNGRVRFDPLPYYKEQRIPRKGLQRGHWANMDMQFHYIGDEMRLCLEAMLLLALQDAGLTHLPDGQRENARRSIDRLLHARAGLEINRAKGRGDFILAMELRRRQVLWNGPGSPEDIHRDILQVVLPAAARSVALTYESMSEAKGLRLRGFSSFWMRDFMARWHPAIPVLGPGDAGEGALVLHRDRQSLAADPDAGEALVFENLVRLHRVARETINLSAF